MQYQRTRLLLVSILSVTMLTGLGLKDLKEKIGDKTGKCDDNQDQKECERKDKLKSVAKDVAVGVAAKLMYDLVVQYSSVSVKGDNEITKAYLKDNKVLPQSPKVIAYEASISPGNLVKAGNDVTVKSSLAVVPGKKTQTVKIEEKIEIFDNEDNNKAIKSLVKAVNDKDLKAGAFENQFSFKLPVGMPQGVYPIKTSVIIDGKAANNANNHMQIVLHIQPNNRNQIAFLER